MTTTMYRFDGRVHVVVSRVEELEGEFEKLGDGVREGRIKNLKSGTRDVAGSASFGFSGKAKTSKCARSVTNWNSHAAEWHHWWHSPLAGWSLPNFGVIRFWQVTP
jgi:hypothetical protein